MKAFLVSLMLAGSAMVVSVAPAIADGSSDDWWKNAFRNSNPEVAPATKRAATAARPAAKTATKPVVASKQAVPETKVASVKPKAVASVSDDGSRPQRKQASKPVVARAPVTSSGTLSGIASYYWQPQPVASGGRFNPEAMTAAHKTLPFGTRVRVTRADTGRSVEVVINDRGPYIAGRIIDLSRRAAREIGMTDVGITKVNVAILGR
jgi:rare lipoprotein A